MTISNHADPNDYDPDALVARLRRNALVSMIGVAILVAAVWQEPMAVVSAARELPAALPEPQLVGCGID